MVHSRQTATYEIFLREHDRPRDFIPRCLGDRRRRVIGKLYMHGGTADSAYTDAGSRLVKPTWLATS